MHSLLSKISVAILAALAFCRSDAQPRAAASPHTYRNIPFTAEQIRWDDRRFLLAALEWRFEGGVGLRSTDPALYSMEWFEAITTTGGLRDGRAIAILPSTFGREPVSEIRVAETAEAAGGYPTRAGPSSEAPTHPDIRGYRYLMSAQIVPMREYLGLWRRVRGPGETLVVYFRPASDRPNADGATDDNAMFRIVGRLPLRLNRLSIFLPYHSPAWNVQLTSEARVGHPIHILHYRWLGRSYLAIQTTSHGQTPSH